MILNAGDGVSVVHFAFRSEDRASKADLDEIVDLDSTSSNRGIQGEQHFFDVGVDVRGRILLGILLVRLLLLFQAGSSGLGDKGEGVVAKDDVLHRRTGRATVGGGEQVLRGQHQNSGFGLSLGAERNVNSHLVTVKVCVIHVTDQRVNLDCLTIHEDRLERLDTESVQGRCTVQKNRVLLNDLFEAVPNRRVHSVDHALGRLDVLGDLLLNQRLHNERLEQLKRHLLRNTALVKFQVRTDDNNGSSGVVNALTEKVLSEAAFLTLKHVAERLKGSGIGADDRAGSATVIDQRIDGFLEKSLFVVDDRFRCVDLDDLLESVVSVDDSAIEIVQVRSRKSTTIELDHGAKLGRDDRNDVQDHPLGAALGRDQGLDDFQALDRASSSLALGHDDFLSKLSSESLQIDANQEFLDRFGADVGTQKASKVLVQASADRIQKFGNGSVLVFVDELVSLQLAQDFDGEVEVLESVIGVPVLGLNSVVDRLGALSGEDFVVLFAVVVKVVRESVERVLFQLSHLLPKAGLFLLHGETNGGKSLLDLLVIDVDDDEAGEVDNLLKQSRRDIENQRQRRRNALEVPNVADRRSELNVAHALASDLRSGDLDAASFTNDAFVFNLLIASASALPVLDRAEDTLTEKTVTLRLERTVVNRFRLLDLTMSPSEDVFPTCDANPDFIEQAYVCHFSPLMYAGYW